jgi:hypothetical protein
MMIGAGAVLALTPWICAAAPAAAATTATKSGTLAFVRSQDDSLVVCNLTLEAQHFADDPNHPWVQVLANPGGPETDCFDDVSTYFTITYTDTGGNTQTTSFSTTGVPLELTIGGTKSNVQVAMTVTYANCASISPACYLTVTVAPK